MTETVDNLYIYTDPAQQVPANKKIVKRACDLASFIQYNATSANALNY